MFFILSKILSFLILPLSWVFLLVAVSFMWKKHSKKFRLSAIVILFLFSNPLLIREVNRMWEVPVTVDRDLDDYDYGVVLGGYASYDTLTERTTFRFAGDRFNQGLRLLEMKKIDQLILSGGSGYITRPDLRESLFIAQFLDDINVPKSKIIIESESRNTRENAINTKQILAEQKAETKPILLITSGYHMRRAVACYQKEGINVIPYTTDPMSGENQVTLDLFLPNAQALAFWNVLMHEWMGYVSYWIMGYI
jgi:uncharacterized SAM-binding protein YcdF (DUF218 family)